MEIFSKMHLLLQYIFKKKYKLKGLTLVYYFIYIDYYNYLVSTVKIKQLYNIAVVLNTNNIFLL